MKRFFRPLAAAALLAALLALTLLPISADVGNVDWDVGGGFDDFGGGYDYDYGGSDFIFIGDGGSGGVSVGTVVIVVVIVLVISYVKSKNKTGSGGASPARPQQTVRQSAANPITEAEEQAVIAQIRTIDPAFAAEQFKTFAGDVILRVQEAWESRDWAVVRPYESDKLFAVHQRQLEEYIAQKKTNHMDNQYIERVTLAAFRADGANEVLTVRVDMSLCDYTTDDATGNIIAGVKNMKLVRAYRLEFIRTAGQKTERGGETKSHTCPSCGAPLDLNAAGRCSYCDCVVTSGEYGWVLNAYNKW